MFWMGKSENLYSKNSGLICSAGFGGRDSEVKSGTTHLKVIRTWKGWRELEKKNQCFMSERSLRKKWWKLTFSVRNGHSRIWSHRVMSDNCPCVDPWTRRSSNPVMRWLCQAEMNPLALWCWRHMERLSWIGGRLLGLLLFFFVEDLEVFFFFKHMIYLISFCVPGATQSL